MANPFLEPIPTQTPAADNPFLQPIGGDETPTPTPEAPRQTPYPGYYYKAGIPPPIPEEEQQVQQGIANTLQGVLDPRNLLYTPLIGAGQDIARAGEAAYRASQGEPIDQINRDLYPEAFRYENFQQQPKQQRAQTISGDVLSVLMGGLLGRGLIGPHPAPAPEPPAAAPPGFGPPMVVPDPYAPPPGATSDLAAAINAAQQTKIQQTLARQAAQQAQPQPAIEQPLVGPGAQWDAAAAAQWHQRMQGVAAQLQQQAQLEQQVTGSVSAITARNIQDINEQIAQGYPAPPERRFVISPPQQPGAAANASQIAGAGKVSQRAVRPPVAQAAPLRPAVAQPPGIRQGAAGPQPSAGSAGGRPFAVPAGEEAYAGQQPGAPPVPPPPNVAKPEVIPRPRAETDAAAARLEALDPKINKKVVDKILNRNAHISEVETALLMRELQRASDAYDQAVDAVNGTQDGSPEQAVAMGGLTDASQRFQNAVDASYKSGTAAGRTLGFRAGIDRFSLARMMREMQANNAGRRLDNLPDVVNRVRELSGKLTDVQQRIQMHAELAREMDATLKEFATKKVAAARAPRAPQLSTRSFLSDAAARARSKIAQRRAQGRLFTGIDPEALYDHAVVGADLMARGLKGFSQWSAEMVRNFGQAIQPYLRQIYDKARQLLEATMATDRKLAAYKTRKRAAIEALQKKIDSGDFTRPERTKLALDREAQELQKEYENLRNQWKKELYIRQKAAMPGWRKTFDAFVEALRAEKLTGIGTLGKIASAAVVRPFQSLAEDVLAQPWRMMPVVKDIAAGAPTERPTLKPYTEYLPATWQGIKEIPSVLRGEHEPPEYSARGPSVLQVPGRIHGAGKNPIKTGEGALGFERARQWALREGLDPNDPEVAAQIAEFARQRGLRGIWMNDNFASRAFRQVLAMLERNLGAPGFVASRIARIFLPIVRVPTNLAIEAMRLHFGIPNAMVRIGMAVKNGVDSLSPAQKDIVMMNLKKGQIGAGLFALGYYIRNQLGGFYNPKTYKQVEQKTGLRPMEMKFLPQWMGAWASHNQPAMAMQAGATFGHLMDAKWPRGTTPVGRGVQAERGVIGGILGDVPFMNQLGNLDKLIIGEPMEFQKEGGQFLRGNIVPVLVQEIARWTDTHDRNGHPIKRYPRDIGQEVEMGIPGLRQTVPTRPRSGG